MASIKFHEPNDSSKRINDDYSKGLDVSRENNIRALHTGIRGGKEKQALTSSIIIRDIASHDPAATMARGDESSHPSAVGGTAAVSSHTTTIPSPSMVLKQQQGYQYPIMTNGELKRLLDKFRIPYKNTEMSGDMLVCMIGEALGADIRGYIHDERQCANYMNALIDSFMSLKSVRPARETSYVHLLTFFLGWISMLQGISNVTSSIGTGEMHTSVPGLNNKKLLCEASKPIMRNMHRKRKLPGGGRMASDDDGGGNSSDDDGINPYGDEIDHKAMLEMMTGSIEMSTQYGSSKAVLRPEYIMVLHEILNYSEPNISIDRALSVVNNNIERSALKVFNVCISINNINTLIQAFDIYDMPNMGDHELEKNVDKTASVRNIVFPLRNTDAFVSQKENIDNLKRFACFRMMRNMPYGNMEPSEFSNLFITSYRKFDTVDNVIRAHALTPYLCLKFLENLLCLSRPQLYDDVLKKFFYPRYQDQSVFDVAARSVAQGTYLTDKPVHQIATISVAKRYTCLALMETYLELNFREKLNRFFYVRNDRNMWYIYHSLFFRRIDLYRYLIERSYVMGRSLEFSITNGTMPTEVAFLQMRNIIVLPLLLILDCYHQMFQCGGADKVCTFRAATNMNKNPRLYSPSAQCQLYHSTMVEMQVPITMYDSLQNLSMKYLRTVFFGRNASRKDLHNERYSKIVARIMQWYHYVTCQLLDLDDSIDAHEKRTPEEKQEMIAFMGKRPALSPDSSLMRNSIPTPSIMSDVEGFRVSALGDPYEGRAVDAAVSANTPLPRSLIDHSSVSSHNLTGGTGIRKRRFHLTDIALGGDEAGGEGGGGSAGARHRTGTEGGTKKQRINIAKIIEEADT